MVFKSRGGAGVLDFRRALGFLQRRFWTRAQGAGASSDELPLLYRAAILYLALPVGVWLIGWFEWWVWLPMVALCGAALWPALRGDWRLRRGNVGVGAVAAVAAAGVLVAATGAGGLLGDNGDWFVRRTAMLDIGRHPWPVFLPETLGIYAAGDYTDPLYRYYLGWHMVPGLAAKLMGPWALNWAVPLWTWAGLSLAMLMFARGRRGWALALALLMFALFSGMDIVRVVIVRGWDYYDVGFGLGRFPWIEITPDILPERVGRVFAGPYPAHMTSLTTAPHHLISAGIFALLLLRAGGSVRLLGALGVLLGCAAFWSAFVAIGSLPLLAALAWRHGLRPFLTWQNLLAAPALGGVIALYFTSGQTDFDGLWIWELRVGWADAAVELAFFWLVEFLALAVLLLWLRPGLRRDPMFIAAVAALFVLPLYKYDGSNNISLWGSMPLLATLCYCCADAVVPAGARGTRQNACAGEGVSRRALRAAGIVCVWAMLAAGSVTALLPLIRGLGHFERVRYEQIETTTLVDLSWYVQSERTETEPPGALMALLADEPAPVRERGRLIARGSSGAFGYDMFLDGDRIVLVKESAARCRERMSNRFVFAAAPADSSAPVRFLLRPENVRGRLFDDTCVVRMPLPEYAASGFAVGERSDRRDRRDHGDAGVWTAHNFDLAAALDSLAAAEPAAGSGFAVHAIDGLLIYAKRDCSADDVRARFFLHIVPEDPGDLPPEWEDRGNLAPF